MGSAVRNENLTTLLNAEGATTPVIAVDRCARILFTPGTDGPAISAAVWATLVTYAFGSITASYTTALTNSANLKFLRLWNQTDAGILVSFNGGTNDHLALAAGATEIYDIGSNGRYISTNVSIKRLSGAPTTGNLYISAYS